MQFKQFLEVSDNLFRFAYNLGEMPRKQVEELLNTNKTPNDFRDRRAFTTNFGWSLPCKEAVDVIKKYARQPLYDVLAGTGYWAKILRKAGINVVASDIHKITNKNHYHQSKENTGAKKISHIIKPEKEKIIRRNALKVGYHLNKGRLKGDIFLSWPPYEEPFATDLLEMIAVGTRVFYIGEGMGGCTGDAGFHQYLCSNFKMLHSEELPQWTGIHDDLTVYEKINNSPADPKYRGKNWYDE